MQGDGLKHAELEKILDASIETQRGDSTHIMPPDKWFGADLYTINICHADKRQAGILALAGWRTADFSQRRRSRVARYLASHIEGILERGFDSLTGFMAWSSFEELLSTMGHTSGALIMHCCISTWIDCTSPTIPLDARSAMKS